MARAFKVKKPYISSRNDYKWSEFLCMRTMKGCANLEAAIASDDRLQLAGSHNNCRYPSGYRGRAQCSHYGYRLCRAFQASKGYNCSNKTHRYRGNHEYRIWRWWPYLQCFAVRCHRLPAGKKSGLQELITAITEIVKGGSPMSPPLKRKVLSMIANPLLPAKQELDLTSEK